MAALLATAVASATPESDYLATRSRMAASLAAKQKAGVPDKILDAEDARDIAVLLPKLVRLVGDVPPDGFSGPAKTSPETLQGGLGFDSLYGVAFSGDSGNALVTTIGLLRAWLTVHQDFWPKIGNVAQHIDAVLATGDFYTQAVNNDAAVSIFATLPIERPSGASSAVAFLIEHSQDLAVYPPEEIAVAIVKGDRFAVAIVPAAIKPFAIAACDAIWKAYEAKQNAANATGKPHDSEKSDAATEKAVQSCYHEKASAQSGFATLVEQANHLALSLARHADGNKPSPAPKH